MKRFGALMAAVGLASAAAGCYEPAYIPPKPTPAEIVQKNATAEIAKDLGGKKDLKENLGKFLEKLGEATTTDQLRAAWAEVYPDHGRVIRRAIAKSIEDFYWPVAPVTDGSVYVEGFRAAAQQLAGS